MPALHMVLTMFIATALGGCAPTTWETPGIARARLDQDDARCRDARPLTCRRQDKLREFCDPGAQPGFVA